MWKNDGKADVENKLRSAFKVFDKNGNGILDLKEFEQAMLLHGEPLLQNETNEMFKLTDANKDGKINVDGKKT